MVSFETEYYPKIIQWWNVKVTEVVCIWCKEKKLLDLK